MFLSCCTNPGNDTGSELKETGKSPAAAPAPSLPSQEMSGVSTGVPQTAQAVSAAPGSVAVPAVQAVQAAHAAEEAGIGPRDFVFQVHSATLNRSFAKFGWMDPYAIISADDKEVSRTKPDKSAHKKPSWERKHDFKQGSLPNNIMIAVWDKNNFHRDVFCGAVTVPCSATMGSLEQKDFTLTKKGKPTGVVKLTLKALDPATGAVAPPAPEMAAAKTLGGEVDQIVGFAEGKTDVQVTLQEHPNHPTHEGEQPEADPEPAVEEPPKPAAAGGDAGPIMGTWKCIDTFGLEDFLKASGVGVFQRKIALAAKWPGWDFTNQGETILFINHSAIGDLKEEIPLGKDYDWKDGHKNPFTCKAEWIPSAEGGCLKISRKGTVGDYVEERTVKGNKLEFVLTHSNGVRWGRTFEKE